MGAKKLDLETYTSAAGQVKIVGLPEVLKKPIYIYISKDDKMESWNSSRMSIARRPSTCA